MNTTTVMSREDVEIAELIQREYVFYREEVKPFTDAVDLAFDKIPVGMLSEMRDFTGHLADAAAGSDCPKDMREGNIRDAHTHLRRVLLDCYKLLCISQRDTIRNFDRTYRWSNLSDVHDGAFVREYTRLKRAAQCAATEAKKSERLGRNSRSGDELGDVYDKYLVAYNAYCEVTKYLDDSIDAVQRVAHKDNRRTFLSVLGWLVGIAATVWGVWVSVAQ